ncbi:MFS transporter [Caldanaerobius polysaccharolyticus]|uniref:MFS transporter n=1 Tax=Caldanaerobius polysaccharolyticus TaxID=44256 RepID=UPI000A7151BB|nr:MFS transporter [Caldanaerobius polysaccharolyticus]
MEYMEEEFSKVAYKNRYMILSAVLIGSMMGPLDGSVVNIAMPTLQRYFHVDVSTISWVAMSYLLVLSSMLLTFGRLGDMLGYKRLFQIGMVLFATSSALCGLSPNIGVLIVARGIQALGAGMMMSMAPAIITKVFPPNERGKALGFNAMAVAVGLAAGPTIGGLLIYAFSWRAIFYINVPIGIIGYLWAQKVVVEDHRRSKEQFDVIGAFTAFVFLVSLLLYISRGDAIGWTSSAGILLLIITGIFLAAFIYTELNTKEPMLDFSLFRNRLFTAGNLSAMFNFIAQFVMTFLTPFFLTFKGFSTEKIGLIMTAFPLTVFVVAPISGSLTDKLGSRVLSTIGALVCSVALFTMSTLTDSSSAFDVIWRLALFGIGNGMFQSPNNTEIMSSAPRERLGVASSVLATMRNVGMVLGIAIGGAIYTSRKAYFSEVMKLGGATATLYGLKDAYAVSVAIALISALLSFVRGKKS